VRAIRAVNPRLILFALPGSELAAAGERAGLAVALEGFADRAYEPDGSLTPRSRAGSVIHDLSEVVRRAVRMVVNGRVIATGGSEIHLRVATLCTHGDTPGAADLIRGLRAGLERAGITIAPVL